jgi:hypothetical protein
MREPSAPQSIDQLGQLHIDTGAQTVAVSAGESPTCAES